MRATVTSCLLHRNATVRMQEIIKDLMTALDEILLYKMDCSCSRVNVMSNYDRK